MRPGTLYLLAYNIAQTLGWSVVLTKAVLSIKNNNSFKYVWKDVALELEIFQTLALLEVVHCLVGLVRSPVATTAMQIMSRLVVLWPVKWKVQSSQQSVGVAIYVLAWSITEVIRYPYYGCSLIGMMPQFLQFIRYTLFIVLYPLGVSGEIITMISALPEIKRRNVLSVDMPNRANMSFSLFYVLIVFMVLYIPFFPQLYFYMFRQRKKVLSPKKEKST